MSHCDVWAELEGLKLDSEESALWDPESIDSNGLAMAFSQRQAETYLATL